MNQRYFLKADWTNWKEVTKDQWVTAERNAGFVNTLGQQEEPGTGGFSSKGIVGRIVCDNVKPDAFLFDPDFTKAVWPQEHCYECGEFVFEGTGEHQGRAGAVHSKCLAWE